jgi:FkbM family methyltransferase
MSQMPSNSAGLFTGAYNLARKGNLLERNWFRGIFIPAYFLYKRWYEDPFWNLTQRKPELFQKGDVLDIGANIGYTSCVFAGAVKAGAKVYAFEPDRASYVLLEKIIRRKRLSGTIETMNGAVGRGEGYLEFWHNEEHSADHRVVTEKFKSEHRGATKTSKVPVTSVDVFAVSRGLENISFIKIDVQGYELAVCEGMQSTVKKFPETCVCFEYDPHALQQMGFEPRELIDFFRSRGYQLHILTRGGIERAPDDASIQRAVDKSGYVDLLCSRKSLAD